MSIEKRALPKGNPFSVDRLLVVGSFLLVILLSVYKLEYYPRTWFDEGENLQVPKNLVLYGKYALRSSDGFRVLDPALTTGPTVLLPIALVLRVFGIGMFQARLVMAVYLVLAILVFYQLTSHLYGRRTAFIALWLLVAFSGSSSNSILYLGRLVMGNVPALFFFLTGALLWMKSIDVGGRGRTGLLLLSGLFLGLAVVTKNHYGLVIPVMAIVWAVDRFYYHKLHWSHVALPLVVSIACLMTWYGAQAVILGPDGFASHIADIRAVSSASVAVFSPRKMLGNTGTLVRSSFLILGVPSLIYVLLSCAGKRLSSVKRIFLLSFVAVWLSWYVLASIGWERYHFAPLAVTRVFVAKLFSDLTHDLGGSLKRIWAMLKQRKLAFPSLSILVTLILLFVVLYPFQQAVKGLIFARDRTPQEFAEFLDDNISRDAVIESWEWELGFLTDHNYHFPTTEVVSAMSMKMSFGVPFPPGAYSFQEYAPDYLIDGPWSKWTGLYPESFLRRNCVLVKIIGSYDLYDMTSCLPRAGT